MRACRTVVAGNTSRAGVGAQLPIHRKRRRQYVDFKTAWICRQTLIRFRLQLYPVALEKQHIALDDDAGVALDDQMIDMDEDIEFFHIVQPAPLLMAHADIPYFVAA